MLWQRILTALIGIPLLLLVTYMGGMFLAGFVLILEILGLHEFNHMVTKLNLRPHPYLGYLFCFLFVLVTYLGSSDSILFVFTLLIFGTMILQIRYPLQYSLPDSAATIMGVIYVGWLASHLILLQKLPIGSATNFFGTGYVWLAFAATWGCDTGAYFIGLSFGKKKLCPAISPNKTVEGAIGGLIGGIVGACLVGLLLKLPSWHYLPLGAMVGVVAQLGDLAESILKRNAGVKDSGRLLPGHGGLLDRFDSVLFVLPVVYYYLKVLIIK